MLHLRSNKKTNGAGRAAAPAQPPPKLDPCPIEIPREEEFEQEEREYLRFDSLERYAQEIKKRMRPDLSQVKVLFLWKRAGGLSAQNAVLGKCKRVPPLVKVFVDVDFIIWFGADNVRAWHPNAKQMEALVFHELCHIYTSEGVMSLIGHDFEAFCREIEIYGMYKTNLLAAGGSFKTQFDLFEQEANDKKAP